MLTKELYEFAPYTDLKTKEVKYALYLGTPKFPMGRLHYKPNGKFAIPSSICISVEPDDSWFVSFCYDTQDIPGAPAEPILRTPEELAYEFNLLTDEALNKVTVGFDRGVALPVASSKGETFIVDPVCVARVAKKERRARRYQRQMAKQKLGGKNYCKTRSKKAHLQGYGKNVHKDFAHKTSHDIVEDEDTEILVFKDLKLKNMAKAPAPKQDAKGRYLPNGAAAKAGLAKSLLSSALGPVKEFATYKAANKNKLVLFINPYNSSNECAQCGHTEPANRKTQAEFECVKCHHKDNADHNAARVIKKRGIALLRSGAAVRKQKNTAKVGAANKPKKAKELVGPVRPKPGG
jgi:putative transposase